LKDLILKSLLYSIELIHTKHTFYIELTKIKEGDIIDNEKKILKI